jgi:hypothetical protein
MSAMKRNLAHPRQLVKQGDDVWIYACLGCQDQPYQVTRGEMIESFHKDYTEALSARMAIIARRSERRSSA